MARFYTIGWSTRAFPSVLQRHGVARLIFGLHMELIIDSELQNFFPKLTENELILLEQNIEQGTIEPRLLVWKGQNIIIDGHNTYEICKRISHEFDIKEIEIESKEQAYLLMIQVQFGRRNLTSSQESYYRGLVVEKILNSQNIDRALSLEEFAEDRKVTPRTLYNDRKYSNAVNSFSEALAIPPTEIVDSGISRAEVTDLHKKVPELSLTQLQKKLSAKKQQKRSFKEKVPATDIKENDLVKIIYTENTPELVGYKTSYAIARDIREFTLDLTIWDKYIKCVPLKNVELVKTSVSRAVLIQPMLLAKIMRHFSSLEEAVKSINFPEIPQEINEGDRVKISSNYRQDWVGTVQNIFNRTYFEIKLDNNEEIETFCLEDLSLQK